MKPDAEKALMRQRVLASIGELASNGEEPFDFFDVAVKAQLPRTEVIQLMLELEESREVRREQGECMPVFRQDLSFWGAS